MENTARLQRPFENEEIFSELDVDPERFGRQVRFLLEVDKLKGVLRQTYLTDASRRENSAEHSWHIALAALIFAEHSQVRDIDISRVVQMLLVHDLIEIDAGDTYCYDDAANHVKQQREEKAAERVFNILPGDQAGRLRELWEEFEAGQTPESHFANALDRLQPFLHNVATEGKSWQEHRIRKDQVFDRMHPVKQGSRILWDYVVHLINTAVQRGYLGW